MQLGLAGQSFDRTGAMCLRSLLCAGIATAVVALAGPARAAWFFEPRATVEPLPDPVEVRTKRQSSKRRNAAEAIAALKTKTPEKLPEGPLQIIISVKHQRLTLYANGQPIARSAVSTGVPGHPTPMGVFSVIEKQIYHESNLYSSAPMPYMQRITWSGVALHQGVVPGHPASHGCIRMPREFAQRLWRLTKVGARVIITQDEVQVADIASGHLFAGKAPDTNAALPQPAGKIRLANADTISDEPLKGSIHDQPSAEQPAAAKDERKVEEKKATATSVENLIDKMVADGAAEADAAITTASAKAPAPLQFDEPPPRPLDKAAANETAKDPMLKPGPISVFISRKTNMLYVRKGFQPVLESPVTIAQSDMPLGTHVFTALKDDGMLRWNVVSLPTEHLIKKGKYVKTITASGEPLRKQIEAPQHQLQPAGDPKAALERITIPEATLARINELVTPGASLIVSDLPQSYETGAGTDFIVLTR